MRAGGGRCRLSRGEESSSSKQRRRQYWQSVLYPSRRASGDDRRPTLALGGRLTLRSSLPSVTEPHALLSPTHCWKWRLLAPLRIIISVHVSRDMWFASFRSVIHASIYILT